MSRKLKDKTSHYHYWNVCIEQPIGAKGIGLRIMLKAKSRMDAIQQALREFGSVETDKLVIHATRVT